MNLATVFTEGAFGFVYLGVGYAGAIYIRPHWQEFRRELNDYIRVYRQYGKSGHGKHIMRGDMHDISNADESIGRHSLDTGSISVAVLIGNLAAKDSEKQNPGTSGTHEAVRKGSGGTNNRHHPGDKRRSGRTVRTSGRRIPDGSVVPSFGTGERPRAVFISEGIDGGTTRRPLAVALRLPGVDGSAAMITTSRISNPWIV